MHNCFIRSTLLFCVTAVFIAVLCSRFQTLRPLQYSCGHTIVLCVTLENTHKIRSNVDLGANKFKAAGRPVAGFLIFSALISD
jgi:hypothetical protein